MFQIKEQDSTKRAKQNADNLLDEEFKTLAIKLVNELTENFNKIKKGMETITNNQSEMKYTLTEDKNNLHGINRSVDEAEKQISNLEYREAKNMQSEQQNNKNNKNNNNHNKKKQNPENIKEPLGHLQAHQHLHNKGTRRRRK